MALQFLTISAYIALPPLSLQSKAKPAMSECQSAYELAHEKLESLGRFLWMDFYTMSFAYRMNFDYF